MLTVSQLSSWSPGTWAPAMTMIDVRRASEERSARELEDAATQIQQTWTGNAARVMVAALRQEAAVHREWAPILTDVSQILQAAITSTSARQSDLAGDVAKADRLDIGVSDPGYCSMPSRPFPTSVAEIATWIALFYTTTTLTRSIRLTLTRATGDDLLSATALARLVDVTAPDAHDGPLDLSDAGIRMQADTNGQDRYGDCVTLSTLMGIARTDPDFIRQHMRWDESAGVYVVTLYDPDTGRPIDVRVDPSTLPLEGSDQAGTSDPTLFSVYEQALRQRFGDDYTAGQTIGHPAPVITGHAAEDVDVDEIGSVLSTRPPGTVVAGVYQDQGTVDPAKRLCSGHAYNVVAVDASGNVTLANPWGPQGGFNSENQYCPGRVTLTPDEYRRWVGGTVAVKQPY